jgi:hypothetical protein
MSPDHTLDPEALRERHPALSPGVALAGVEACAVCLVRRHEPPTTTSIEDAGDTAELRLMRELPSESVRRAWREQAQATEKGAEILAILCVETRRGLVAVDRALRGSRVDYYLGEPGGGLEGAAVLEVGGIDDGNIKRLLERKRLQASRNPDRLPALAAAVRFADPRVMIADVEKHS